MANRDLFTHIRKRPAAMVAAGALVMGGLVAVPAAMAGTTPPYDIDDENFAIDVAGVQGAFLDDNEGSIKELGPINGSSTKLGVIHTASVPMLGLTNPNAQVDLRGAWLDTRADADEDQWLYFAWERDSSNGSGIIMYEFQQKRVPAACDYSATNQSLIDNCNPWAGRQKDDFILVWDQQGTDITILKRVFDGTQFEPAPGTPLGSAKAVVSADGFFGEAALNLTDDVFNSTPECTAFTNVIPGTVTGNSDTADYKDTILKDAPDISNCGRVEITKDAGGETGTFNWTVERSSGEDIRYAADGYSDLKKATDTIEDSETDKVEDLKAASDYTLVEAGPPDPFELDSITCKVDANGDGQYSDAEKFDLTAGGTFKVLVGKTTYCTIVNGLQDGTLVVNKVVKNDNGGTDTASKFKFKVNGGEDQTFDETADQDNDPETGTWSKTYAAGTTVSVAENNYSPEYATSYTNSANSATNCADLKVPAGGTVTCTITNDDQPGKLIVKKVVENNWGGEATRDSFYFDVSGPTSSTGNQFESDGSNELTVNAGTYSVTEPAASMPFGYSEKSNTCSSVDVALGQTKSCTITNEDLPAVLTVNKVVVHDTGGPAPLSASAFAFTVTTGSDPTTVASAVSFATDGDPLLGSADVKVAKGTYTATEDDNKGYNANQSDCVDVVVPFAGTAECTIYNTYPKESPVAKTVQSWVMHDSFSAEIRPGASDAAGADVTFALFTDQQCKTPFELEGSAYQEVIDVTLSNGGATVSAATSTGAKVTESGTYYWTAEYSGDAYNKSAASGCIKEVTQIKATDDYPRDDLNLNPSE